DVVPVFQTDREPDPLGMHAKRALLVVGQGRMSHGKWVLDQGFDLPQADGERYGVGVLSEVVHQFFSPALPAVRSLQYEVHHAAGGELPFGTLHLPAGQFLLAETFGPGIADSGNLGMLTEELRYP